MDLAECNEQRPWVTLLAGPQAGEDRVNLLFDQADPCGVETDATGATRFPLIELDAATGCVGGGRPGDMVLVRGHVQSRNRTVAAGRVKPEGVPSCDGVSAHPRLKLRVSSCGWRGPIIIDADSAIVVPAGDIDVAIIGPNDWSRGAQVVELSDTLWTDASVRVSVCPTTCCSWEGALTEWSTLDIATPEVPILVRPRRADAVQVNGATALGAAQNVVVQWLDGEGNVKSATVHATSVLFPLQPVGSFPLLRPQSTVGVLSASLRWRIR